MIDQQTVQQILDAADIVDVVSDFVALKRKGANYMGLCPFHNEKTPSFSVSRSKGICKCFSCGQGGSPVNFIMAHEQLSYYEALKYLAKKYHIEIKERELSEEEKNSQTERESMLNINDVACSVFEDNLLNSEEGQAIGLSYFRERGVNDLSLKKYKLGYSLDSKDALYNALTKKGLDKSFIFKTGLCSESQYGSGGYDRFKGRVMFPVQNLAGKIVAFGGRTLKNDNAKYVNSPESEIYKKNKELYGIFQAKHSIAKHNKCFLVEGYMDVISMFQAGIENVVASSGTSLTEGQIRLIHRFTENVTVLYDGDSAGIKAAMRGIDMLLAEGLNIKVLLLPDGHDPDSFARSLSSSELIQYIDEHEQDFIQFKTDILLKGAENDPIKRSEAIQDLVSSIAVIPQEITRAVYAKECSRHFEIDESILVREIGKKILKIRDKESEKAQRKNKETEIEKIENEDSDTFRKTAAKNDADFSLYERALIRYIVKYGMNLISSVGGELTIFDYIRNELSTDDMCFSDPAYSKIYMRCAELSEMFDSDFHEKFVLFQQQKQKRISEGQQKLMQQSLSVIEIEEKEKELVEIAENMFSDEIASYRSSYFETRLCSDPDDDVRTVSTSLSSDRYKLSKIHTRFTVVESELSRLDTLVPEAISNWKNALLDMNINELKDSLKSITDIDEINEVLMQIKQLQKLKTELNALIGDRVLNPQKR